MDLVTHGIQYFNKKSQAQDKAEWWNGWPGMNKALGSIHKTAKKEKESRSFLI